MGGKHFAALVALVALVQTIGSHASSEICGIDESLRLTTSDEFEELALVILNAAHTSESCPESFRSAIRELREVVRNEDVCSRRKAEQIYKFHTAYLLEKKTKLPKPVKNFFVGFALKVSETCRGESIARLLKASDKLTEKSHWHAFDKFIHDDGLLTMVIDSTDNDEFVPPVNLIKMLDEKNQRIQDEKVFLQTNSVLEIRHMQVVCRRKLAPLYEPELLPLVTLASIGYKYDAAGHRRLSAEDKLTQMEVLKWYRVIFLCESLRNIELVGAPADTSRQQVGILSQQDAEELQKKSPELFQYKDHYSKLTQTEYAPPAMSLPEPIVDTNDQRFVKAIKEFKAREGLIGRVYHKMGDYFKDKITRGAVKYYFGKHGIQLGDTKIRNVDELIKALDLFSHKFYYRQLPSSGIDHATFNRRASKIFWRSIYALCTVGIVTLFVVLFKGGK